MAKKPCKEAQEHYSRVAELGCIICGRPAELHHLTGAGMGLKSHWSEVIPLCPEHHRTGKDAVHAGKKSFEAKFGTQRELLEIVRSRLNVYK